MNGASATWEQWLDGPQVCLGLVAIVPFLIWAVGEGLRAATRKRRLDQIRRIERRICTGCGYDVRASKDHCPECGARVPSRRGGTFR